MRHSVKIVYAALALCFWLNPSILDAQDKQTTPIRVSVEPGDHSVSYRIGQGAKLRFNDPRLSSQFQNLGNEPSGTKIIFLIGDDVPLSQLSTIAMIVDKYDLTSVRFFVCDYGVGQMVEIKRNEDGMFAWTAHRVVLSDHPSGK